MNLLGDIITYIRRLVKTANNSVLTDNLIIDYINRFWLIDMDARVQLYDFKTKYSFQTTPGVTQYNMPLYGVNSYPNPAEPGNQTIGYYPVYQGFLQPCYVNGIQVPFYVQKDPFYKVWPNYVQSLYPAGEGDGGPTYTLSMPFFPALQGHVDITGIIAANSSKDPIIGLELNPKVPLTSVYPAVQIIASNAAQQNLIATDSGQFFLSNITLGLLQGDITSAWGASTNVVNYNSGEINVTFNEDVPAGAPIQVQCYFFQSGIPRAVLFYNNCITLLPPPDIAYYVEMEAYLTPAALLNSAAAIPFAHMAEYIARGAARKILSDTGDMEQFTFYEPLFKEQETLVWKRSQRQFTAERTSTIFSDLSGQSPFNNYGQGT